MKTFNHRDDPSLDYAEDFIAAWSNKIGQDWRPPPMDAKRIKAGSREMFNSFGYIKGFVGWAMKEHCRNYPDTRYVPSPTSLRYLLEKFKYSSQKKDYFVGLEE